MIIEIISIYCITDDLLKLIGKKEDERRKMTDAEVITTAIVAVRFFGGNFEYARIMLKEHNYIPDMLSKSQFNRRLHSLDDELIFIFCYFSELWKKLNKENIYLIDSFPVAVCENCRIPRCKIYTKDFYRGYQASKKRYFFGLKVHLIVTLDGRPVEVLITEGSYSDVCTLKDFNFDLEIGSKLYCDKAYNDYFMEDLFLEAGIHLKPIRKSNSKRKYEPWVAYLVNHNRKMIETTNSQIEKQFPKSIHAVNAKGFEIKVFLFILSYNFNCLLK